MVQLPKRNLIDEAENILEVFPCLTLFYTMLFSDVAHCTCGVVLQHRVLAEGLEPPGYQNILEVCWGGEVTAEDHWGKQSRAALLLGNNHLNAHRHCGGTRNVCLLLQARKNKAISRVQILRAAHRNIGLCLVKMQGEEKSGQTETMCVWGVVSLITKWQNQKNRWHKDRKWLTVKLPRKHSEPGMKPVESKYPWLWTGHSDSLKYFEGQKSLVLV